LGARSNPRKNAGYVLPPEIKPLQAGDRILVQKYLYELFPPKRWDVVVFKNPELATQNFIKRLIGLPGEEVWIVDGDIFTRPNLAEGSSAWQIERKPARTQNSLWRPIFSSEFAPIQPEVDGLRWFKPPWEGAGWESGSRQVYRCETDVETSLAWNSRDWPVWDWVPYNEWPRNNGSITNLPRYPVGDVRLRAGIEPDGSGLEAIAMVQTRGHEFRAVLEDDRIALEMRQMAPASSGDLEWIELEAESWDGFAPGFVTSVEFWHVDQSLALVIDGDRLLEASYEWNPSDRLRYATGRDAQQHAARQRGTPSLGEDSTYDPVKPTISWTFRGSALSMHRVGLDRDLYYEPVHAPGMGPGLGTHPNKTARLGPDHYFVLGDNSPSSKDGRLWSTVDRSVRQQIDAAVGVVPRKLMLGKAFFVYFPAPHMLGGRIPIPDFGHMRFIR
jgi:signal peptidase I